MTEQPESTDKKASTYFERLNGTECKLISMQSLKKLKAKFSEVPSDPEAAKTLVNGWDQFVQEIQIIIGTLLRVDNISILLGSGASKYAGAPLIGKVPLQIEKKLIDSAIVNGQLVPWIVPFYHAAKRVSRQSFPEITGDWILERHRLLQNQTSPDTVPALDANYEELLSTLDRWDKALGDCNQPLEISAALEPTFDVTHLSECTKQVKAVLAEACEVPKGRIQLEAHRNLLRRLLARPLNLKRASIFTLNYDTLVEQAADEEGITLIDGFLGTVMPAFRPEVYDQDLYFPGNTTEGKVHRLEKVLHLYKLHGSLNWIDSEPTMANPYGVARTGKSVSDLNGKSLLIYPMTSKFGDTLGLPYSELFRRFASAVVRPQSILISLGYGFGDEHVNAIIKQALSMPSFSLLIVDPVTLSDLPSGKLHTALYQTADDRVSFIAGNWAGKFENFASCLLPNLRDEEIFKKIEQTRKAIQRVAVTGDEQNAE